MHTCTHTNTMPYTKVIGNGRAKRKMLRCRHQFLTSDVKPNIALIGPASCGKTYFARIYAKSLSVPFVEIQPHSVKDMRAMYETITMAVGRKSLVDPCVIFIDEVHNLNKHVEQALLKAVEKSDCILETEEGIILKTQNISWVVATTEWGNLFGPFKTRFRKVSLRLYTKAEIAQIVGLSFPGFSDLACQMVAKYSAIPREALSFAREVLTGWDMQGRAGDIEKLMVDIADDSRIDKWGMTFHRRSVLAELGQGPIAKSRLAGVIQVGPKELEQDIMPPLLHAMEDCPVPLVGVCSKGYHITSAGLLALILRGISHRGHHAIPQSLWCRYPEMFEDDSAAA